MVSREWGRDVWASPTRRVAVYAVKTEIRFK